MRMCIWLKINVSASVQFADFYSDHDDDDDDENGGGDHLPW